MLYHCHLICVSPKHGLDGSLRCLKILYIHNCWNLFFVPEPLWNSDNQKLANFKIGSFYHSLISPFAVHIFSLPFSSHCSTQNIGFSNSGHVIKPAQPSSSIDEAPPFTVHLRIVHNYNLRYHREKELCTSCHKLIVVGSCVTTAFKTKCVGSVYFASWANSTAGTLLLSDKHSSLKWSHYKFKTHVHHTW